MPFDGFSVFGSSGSRVMLVAIAGIVASGACTDAGDVRAGRWMDGPAHPVAPALRSSSAFATAESLFLKSLMYPQAI